MKFAYIKGLFAAMANMKTCRDEFAPYWARSTRWWSQELMEAGHRHAAYYAAMAEQAIRERGL